MKDKNTYFSNANRLFWVLISIVVVLSIMKLNFGIFDTEDLATDIVRIDSLSKIDWDEVVIDVDSSSIDVDSTVKEIEYLEKVWKWKDFNGTNYVLNFKIKKNDYLFSRQQRINSENYSGDLYSEMYINDNRILDDMINSYKSIIQSKGLSPYESMEMIVTSIQSIPYTYVLTSEPKCGEVDGDQQIPNKNCAVSSDPCGCCENVIPFAVYTPVEFAVQRTADCDTRSLFAYTILKRLGFDVAVMVSRNEVHSVLGVSVPNIPGDGRRGNVGIAKKYFLWELTAYGPVLGQYIDGSDWEIALN
ncbi:hypothetical protein [Daejeonella sp.]|jgi:hypothetical protein|uniref:hypothetical protein n=1 Tax=Daejeonella sp. TaxID=2805397 RepID=UPI0037BF0F7C